MFLLQQYFVCDYDEKVDCKTSESFYSLNDNFGQAADNGEGERQVSEAGS
jgi:hypothetical protein